MNIFILYSLYIEFECFLCKDVLSVDSDNVFSEMQTSALVPILLNKH
jgi:hypothetical protein